MLVPVGMGYAQAAGLPPITGLYATIVPLVAYAAFGPSRVMVLGPDSSHDDLVLSSLLDGVVGRVGSDAQRTPSAREPGQEDGEGVGDLRLVVDEDLGGAMELTSGQA